MRSSDFLPKTSGKAGGFLLGQTKIMRIVGSPATVDGTHFGMSADAVLLVNREFFYEATDRNFIEFLFGPETDLETVSLSALINVPFIGNLDPRDALYTRVV